MKIFGKTFKEYIWPIKHYIIGSVLVVIAQYYVAVPLNDRLPFILNLTQALWAIMVALSVIKLTLYYDFDFKNVIILGLAYSVIIHGLKAFVFRIFLFPYDLPAEQIPGHLLNRFLYGSLLVMAIAIILGLIFIKLKNNQEIRTSFKWL